MSIRTLVGTLAAALLLAGPVLAQTPPATADDVIVVVNVPTPPGVTPERLRAEFEAATPRYQQIPGLITKSFTIGDGTFGGVYLWTDRAAADAWFSDAWRQRVVATYGAPARVDYLDAPLTIRGAASE